MVFNTRPSSIGLSSDEHPSENIRQRFELAQTRRTRTAWSGVGCRERKHTSKNIAAHYDCLAARGLTEEF